MVGACVCFFDPFIVNWYAYSKSSINASQMSEQRLPSHDPVQWHLPPLMSVGPILRSWGCAFPKLGLMFCKSENLGGACQPCKESLMWMRPHGPLERLWIGRPEKGWIFNSLGFLYFPWAWIFLSIKWGQRSAISSMCRVAVRIKQATT